MLSRLRPRYVKRHVASDYLSSLLQANIVAFSTAPSRIETDMTRDVIPFSLGSLRFRPGV